MVTRVNMPKLGLTMQRGQVLKWFKNEGDKIEKDEPLVEIETEKVVFVVEARAAGILRKIIAKEGEVIGVGGLLGIIADEDEEISQLIEDALRMEKVELPAPEPEIRAEGRSVSISEQIKASPRAKKLAKERGVDLILVKGTGSMGQISEKDVDVFLQSKIEKKKVKETRPYIGVRKTIGQRMSESLRVSPQFTMTTDVDMDELVYVYKEIVPKIAAENGVNITYTEMIAKIVSEVLRRHPLLNASLDGDKILIYESINLGIAVASEQGLIVPVILDTGTKALVEISRDMKTLVEKVRSKTLSLEDVTGGTFTISSLGMMDVDTFTPIINPPESAILGIGKIKERPIASDGNIIMKPVAQLSLTVDHRIVDGMDASKFLQNLKRAMEDPYQSLGIWRFGQARAVWEDGMVVRWQTRKFKSFIDEPFELGGTNQGPNPVEEFMAAFASCFILMLKVAASARELLIDRIEASVQPDSIENISHIHFDLLFHTQESKETIEKLLTIAEKLCPIHRVIRKDIPIDFNLKVISPNLVFSKNCGIATLKGKPSKAFFH
jgi:pyruvate dehydrogenase E2 component (dihydrolipoamide acetyltransferase)